MEKWFELEKTDKGIVNFIECNQEFHDYRLENIQYIPGKDMIEVFLKYDTMREGILLRFMDIRDIHIEVEMDYYSHWISGSGCTLTSDNTIIWVEDSDWQDPTEVRDHLDDLKKYTSWIEAGGLCWALTDGNGKAREEVPETYYDQTWSVFGKTEKHHFDLKEFRGDWALAKPGVYGK